MTRSNKITIYFYLFPLISKELLLPVQFIDFNYSLTMGLFPQGGSYTLDVWGVPGIGGFIGTIFLGVFASIVF